MKSPRLIARLAACAALSSLLFAAGCRTGETAATPPPPMIEFPDALAGVSRSSEPVAESIDDAWQWSAIYDGTSVWMKLTVFAPNGDTLKNGILDPEAIEKLDQRALELMEAEARAQSARLIVHFPQALEYEGHSLWHRRIRYESDDYTRLEHIVITGIENRIVVLHLRTAANYPRVDAQFAQQVIADLEESLIDHPGAS